MAEIARYTRYRSTPDIPPSTAFPREHILYYPLLDLKLRKDKSTTPTLKVLIDSGAAYCIFGSDTATLLHIDVHSGNGVGAVISTDSAAEALTCTFLTSSLS